MIANIINKVVRDGPLQLDCPGDYSLIKSGNTYLVSMAGNKKNFDELHKAYWYIIEHLAPKRKTTARLIGHSIAYHIFVDGQMLDELLAEWAEPLIEKMSPYDFEIDNNNMTVYCNIPIPNDIPAKVANAGYKLQRIKVSQQYRASPKLE